MSSVLRTEGRLEDLLVCSAFFFCRCGVIYCRTKDVTKVCTLTAQYSVQEPHAPQLFRFPLPQTLQLVSKSKPMEQAKSHGKRGILHVSLRRATLLTALARTGSPKASSCSKTSDGEQDPWRPSEHEQLLLHLSTSFYNQPLGFLHFCHQSLPAVLSSLFFNMFASRFRGGKYVIVKACGHWCQWAWTREGAGARGWKGVQYYDTPISQRSPLFSSFLLLLASICCTTEVIQLFTTFWMAVFSIFSWLARFHTLWTGSFCLSCLLRFHDSLSYYMKSANRAAWPCFACSIQCSTLFDFLICHYIILYIYIYVCTCLYCSWTLARSPHVSLKFSFIQHWISWTYFGRTAFHILSFIWLKAHSDSCFFVDCVYVYSLYVYIYIYIHMTHTHHCSLFGFYVNHISCSFFRLPLKKLI